MHVRFGTLLYLVESTTLLDLKRKSQRLPALKLEYRKAHESSYGKLTMAR